MESPFEHPDIEFLNWLVGSDGIFPDFIISDFNMGRTTLNGLELLAFMKNICSYLEQSIHILIMTYYTFEDLQSLDTALSDEEFLSKKRPDFYEAINGVIAKLISGN